MAGVVIGRNEFLRCTRCLWRVPVAQLAPALQNLLVEFGAPKCPRCGDPNVTWERYTVIQMPIRRDPQPSAEEATSDP